MTVEQPMGNDPTVSNVMRPLSDSAGWMKLIGTLAIIYGAILAITIVGLIIAWLPIWMGVLLRRAADDSVKAHRTGSQANAVTATTSLQTFFKVQGILVLIGLVFAAVALVFSIVAVVAGGDIDAMSWVPFVG
jgi:Family of unknown function (DUF5362)